MDISMKGGPGPMLKVASTILIIVALLSVAIGVVYVARGTFMPYHEQFLDMTMEDVRDFNPNLATLAIIFIRLTGILFIGAGISLVAIIYHGLRKAKKWAWWTALIELGVMYAPMAVITEPVGGFPWISTIIMLVVSLIAIGLAGKEVFG